MEWDTISNNIEQFWNKPVPIIGFTIGMCIIGIVFIISKTSIGKKALNILKKKIEDSVLKLEEALQKLKEATENLINAVKTFNEFKKECEEKLNKQKEYYEKELNKQSQIISKQDKIIKVICENSVNIHIKEAFEEYGKEEINN